MMENLQTMEYIKRTDLELMAESGHSQIYKYLKPYKGLSMVVKETTNPQVTINNLNMLTSTGCMKVLAELCDVDGKKAILMENLFTDDMVYVFPNTYRGNWKKCAPELYLYNNKIKGIANMDSLICQVRDFAHACDSKGIELLIDMLSFGVPKGDEVPEVSYKVVDVDGMGQDDARIFKLTKENIGEAKWALRIFVEYCVEDSAQADLLAQIENFKW